MSIAENPNRTVRWRRVLVLLPLGIFLGLVVLFLIQLNAGDPSLIPSALIGQPAPQTTLPPIAGLERDGTPVPGVDPADFKGAVTVVNVWASWCVPCHDEAPLLAQLGKDTRFRLVGINYKDDPDNARRFLGRYGNQLIAVEQEFAARPADFAFERAVACAVAGRQSFFENSQRAFRITEAHLGLRQRDLDDPIEHHSVLQTDALDAPAHSLESFDQ